MEVVVTTAAISRAKLQSMDLLTPISPGSLPTLSLTTNSSWLPWGRVAMPLISHLMPVSTKKLFAAHPLLTSLSARRVLSPPETDRLLLRDQGSGTVCQMTLQLLHLCLCFNENWKCTCFGSHIQILFCRLSLLAVSPWWTLKLFYLGHCRRIWM